MISAEDLKDISIFACLPVAERERLVRFAADLRLNKGDTLIREGETPWFFVLLEGSVTVEKQFGASSLSVHKFERGEFFGEVPILLGTPALATLTALEPVRALRLDRLQFQELIDKSPECSAVILRTMNSRVARISEYVRGSDPMRVLVVGSQYDVDCRDIRSFLSLNRIPYEWVDREREPERVPSCMPPDMSGPAVVVDKNFCVGQPPTIRKVADALGIRTVPRREDYDVVIVGGGPAGLAAAVYGASEGLCVLLVERSAAGGQAGTSSRIENYLGFPGGISGEELSERALRQAEKFTAEIVLTREVQNIEPMSPAGYCVELDGGDRVRTKTVILATGVDWRRLQADGLDRLLGRGVLYGASKTESSTVNGKDVFIVGGGNSAGQAAMFFSSYARSVTMLVRSASLELCMSSYLIEQIASKRNIQVENGTQVISADGVDHLELITTKHASGEEKTRSADALFVMIGAKANTKWLPDTLQRDENGYVCTGRDIPDWENQKRMPFLLETNLPGLFCAGDVRHDSIKRVSSGVGEGSMAIAFVHQYLALMSPSQDNAAL